MFLPEEMTEIALIVPEGDVLAITELLTEQGVFHHADAGHLGSGADSGIGEDWQQDCTRCSALERRILALMQMLGIREDQPKEKLAKMPVIDIELARSAVDDIEQEVQELAQSLELEGGEYQRFQGPVAPVEAEGLLDIDVSEILNLRYIVALFGTMPSHNVERLRTSLQNIPFVLQTLSTSERHTTVLLFGARRDADVLRRAARSAYLSPLRGPQDYREMPDEIAAAIQSGIKRAQKHMADRRSEIEGLYDKEADKLRELLWRVRMRESIAQTILCCGRRRSSYILLGWLPSDRVEEVTRQIQQASDKVSIVTDVSERHEGDRRVPTALNNPKGLKPFETLVTNYGYPRYGEIDPTPLLALTFPLIFGIMFGDLGQGMLLALIGGFLMFRSMRAGTVGVGSLLLACGVAATVFGVLYGSVFGMEDVIPALWMQPLENIIQILLAAVAVGAVLLNVGLIAYVVNAWIARDWIHLVFGHKGIAGIVLYWSLIGLAVKALAPSLPLPLSSTVLALLGGLAGLLTVVGELIWNLIAGQRPLVEGSVGTHLIQMALELFETLLSFFSNTLSYVRMGAFAVAHGGLSAVIFILANMASPTHGIGYWAVVVLGNLIVVGFEGLIVGIQTLRLEYYEFLSKFFRGGGKAYTPLRLFPQGKE